MRKTDLPFDPAQIEEIARALQSVLDGRLPAAPLPAPAPAPPTPPSNPSPIVPTNDPVLNAALAEQARAEARKATAEARKAEAEARTVEVTAAAAERDEKEKLADWRYQHVLMVYGGITEASVRMAMDRLNVMDHGDPTCSIEIVFNSHGGEAFWGMCLFDYICQLRKTHKITTVGMGAVMSMAAILLQAGDVRVMGREAWLLIHEVQSEAIGKPGDLRDATKWADKMCERVKTIFVSRSNGKLTAERVQEGWDRKDWTLDADEALALGIIDEVRPPRLEATQE